MATLQPGNYVIKSSVNPLVITLRGNNQVGTIPGNEEAPLFHVWSVRPDGKGRFFFQRTGSPDKKYIAVGVHGVTGSDRPYAWSIISNGLFWRVQDSASGNAALTFPGSTDSQLTLEPYNGGRPQLWNFQKV